MRAIRRAELALICAATLLTATAPVAAAAVPSSAAAAGAATSVSAPLPEPVDEEVPAVPAPATAPADRLSADSGADVTSFGFTVTPQTVAPGGTVTLKATECASPTVTASSGVFDTVTLTGGQAATARVFDEAEPGAEHVVTFDCKGERGSARIVVEGAGPTADRSADGAAVPPGDGGETGDAGDTGVPDAGAHDTGAHDTGTHDAGAQDVGGGHDTGSGHEPGSALKPGGGVTAGGGGSLPQLSPTHLAFGSALVSGAVGAGLVLMRRRRAAAR
ncbi:hypothetical protein ACH4E8_30850 [Streptomyces sp. NPDC017979]|uniref:hypothetical protein n=1 Tax=Streptomyces sp. NPDC017979 TaxID=3365024 RepID=UPI003792AC5F